MALPVVAGWLVDYRTASAIFDSGSNERINHCTGMCQAGGLCFCSSELKFFRQHAKLEEVFINDNECMIVPDDGIMPHTEQISQLNIAKPFREGAQSIIIIAATAIVKNYGVISDHHSDSFVTVSDICAFYGVPVLTAEEYFAAL